MGTVARRCCRAQNCRVAASGARALNRDREERVRTLVSEVLQVLGQAHRGIASLTEQTSTTASVTLEDPAQTITVEYEPSDMNMKRSIRRQLERMV
jgi:hypothetical protein